MIGGIAKDLVRQNIKDMKARAGRKLKQQIRYFTKKIFRSCIIPCS